MVGTVTQRTVKDRPVVIWTSIDDSVGIGDGSNKLLFKLGAGTGNKKVPMEFSERIDLRSVLVSFVDAPFGAAFSLVVRRRSDNNLRRVLVDSAQIHSTDQLTLPIEGVGKIPTTMKLQGIVTNSSGTAPEDPAAAFKVRAVLGMNRATLA